MNFDDPVYKITSPQIISAIGQNFYTCPVCHESEMKVWVDDNNRPLVEHQQVENGGDCENSVMMNRRYVLFCSSCGYEVFFNADLLTNKILQKSQGEGHNG